MRAVLTVFAKEFRENLRERCTLISALSVRCSGRCCSRALLSLGHGAQQTDKAVTLAVAHGERAPNLLAFLRHLAPLFFSWLLFFFFFFFFF